jgi:hypothetical protein
MIILQNGRSYDVVELQEYVRDTFYIYNSEEDEYVLDESSSITQGRTYFIEQNEKYIEVKLFEPNKYYIKNYVNCESLKFDSVNNVYYIYTEDG